MIALVVAALTVGCGASRAHRSGQKHAEQGDWDLAVARFTKALHASPRNIKYKISLENAKIQASRFHTEQARKQLQTGNFEKAMEEFGIATNYDPSNKAASDDRDVLRVRMEKLAADKRRAKEMSARRPADAVLPVPFLYPRSPVPITLRMTASIEKVYQTLGTLAGVNVVFDPDMQNKDKTITSNISGVTFQEALDQVGLINKKAYRVLDRNTILIFDDTNAQTRQRWDDQVMRTFYLENVEAKDLEAPLRTALGAQTKVTKNDATNSITVISTLDEMALADRFIRSNDKAKGEFLVEVEILEINRTQIKKYGLQLSNYEAGIQFSPTGAANEVDGGLTSLRAHMLSSLNSSDWVVQIPSRIFSAFLHSDSNVKILSSTKLRVFEGKKASFKVGSEVPIPQFFPGYPQQQPTQGGTTGGTFGSASATYKNVGVELEVDKAKVSVADEIQMDVKAEFSILGDDKNFGTEANPNTFPTFLTRRIENSIRMIDGQTSVIGGLLQSREARSLQGALGLQSIPILNKILGKHDGTDEEIEVLISLTPHILRAPNVLEEDVEPLYLGLRNNLKIPGVRPLFGPEEVEPEVDPAQIQTPPGHVPMPAPGGASATTTPTPSVVAALPRAAAPAPTPSSLASVEEDDSTKKEESEKQDVPPARMPPAETPTTTPAPAESPTPAVPLASRSAWDRTEVQMKVGEIQRVAVNLFNARSVKDVSIAVRTDSPSIEFVEIGPGQLLSVDGVQVLAERQLEGQRAAAQLRRATPLAGGTGTVVIVGFRANRPGEATIFVESLSLSSGTTQSPVPLAGAVRVTVNP